ncbi:hypothetical protein ACFQL1_12485 [Halomicroarcula sp. GCM10025709]
MRSARRADSVFGATESSRSRSLKRSGPSAKANADRTAIAWALPSRSSR